ncbi:MAG: fructose-1,6-bisphosphatase [Candidatus Methylacidiphilales bacterium]
MSLVPQIGRAWLDSLARECPNVAQAAAEIALIEARLGLPKPVTHVISDVHGEFAKLRHVINNASGTLRPLVASLFNGRLDPEAQRNFLTVLYYPHELHRCLGPTLANADARGAWVRTTLRLQFEVVRELARTRTSRQLEELVPVHFRRLFNALYREPYSGRSKAYTDAMIAVFARNEMDLDAVRAASRLVRNLAVGEIIVAGDFGDRGPRMDRVIDYLRQQPQVAFTWGNHDAAWMGACLGSRALIAHVLRISLRYRRLFQLEEGYGILLLPLEQLANQVYGQDPCLRFLSKNVGLRDAALVARMQKAAAILQFKLEGQLLRRRPEWGLAHRNLLEHIDNTSGTVRLGERQYPLLDTAFPTVDPADPYELTPEEQTCIERLRDSFISSQRLWEHMRFIVQRGAMWLVRDDVLIFHGCVPTRPDGSLATLSVDGRPLAGRALFTALDEKVRWGFRRGATEVGDEVDWFWYLWCGPLSPLFGKDKVATFENYFVADPAAGHETKDPYFEKIHQPEFVRQILTEFGVDPAGLVVNGHVPVRVEKGENPVKRGGNAVTIDGAFSEAYGDHGYTLLIAPDRIDLAEHHHFEGVGEAVLSGADIVPTLRTIRRYSTLRRVGDTEEGASLRERAAGLEALIHAYQSGRLFES